MSKAEEFKKIKRPIGNRNDVTAVANSIDPKCRIQKYLYTERVDIVFSDGSKALVFNNGQLINVVR